MITLLLLFAQAFGFSQKPWVTRNVGAIEVLEYDPNQVDVAFISSREGVLAAINVKTGKFRWRQILPEGERIDKMVVHKHKLVTLSAGRITRVWKSLEGDMVWEDGHFDEDYVHPKEKHELGNADVQIVRVDGFLCVLTLTVTGEVRLRKFSTGESLWDVDHDDHHTTPARAITVDEAHDHIFTIAFPEDSHHLQVTVLQASNGVSKGSRVFELRHPVSTSNVLFKGQYLVMLGAGDAPDVDIMYLDGDFTHRPTHFEQQLPSREDYTIENLVGPLFAVKANSVTLVYEIQETGAKVKLEELRMYEPVKVGKEAMAVAVGAFQNREKELFLCSIRQNFDGAEIEWYEVAMHDAHKQMVPFYDHEKHGDVLRIFPHVTPRGLSRAMVLSEDYALTFVTNGNPKPLWVREESLAMITQMKIIDFPVELEKKQGMDHQSTFSDLFSRLQYDLMYLKSVFEGYTSFDALTSGTDPEVFGFRQLIIALSKSGKIFGINSLTGKVIMKKFLPTLTQECKPLRFFQMKEMPPVFAIVAQCDNSCQILHFDIISEKIVDTQEMESQCKGVYRLPGNSIAVLNGADQLFVVSGDQEEQNLKNMFFFNTDYENNRIQGFGVKEDTTLWPAWTVDFSDDEEIIQVHQRDDPPKIADTLYRPGGARVVMLKYLNPHMVVVVTQVKDSAKSYTPGGINVYLLDTVNGEIIHQIHHPNAVQPVALVTFENRVVYSFWNQEKLKNVVYGLSLWSSRSKDKTKEDGFSSFVVRPPELAKGEIFQRAWFFDASPITNLAVSTSRFGFAVTTILATLANGQVYTIDAKRVDPRQVEGDLKAADKEEQLMPYTPVIPYIHPKIITQGNEVARVSGITCGFAKVESTSVVVAYGVDVFATLMTPAPFDMLGDDFDKGLLLIIVLAVLAAIIVSKYFANDAVLKRGWQ